MPDKERFNYLLDLYLSGNLSAEQHSEFFAMMNTNRYDHLLSTNIFDDLKEGNNAQSADLPPHVAHEIIRNIYQTEKRTREMLPVIKPRSIAWKWMAAASILLVVSISVYFALNNRPGKTTFASLIPNTTISKTNSGSVPLTIQLADGSAATLSPKSTLHYSKQFTGDKREVYLEGEAFFKVAKNQKQPFLVYYHTIVTRVLGTSFSINTRGETGDIEVAVHTGKVQVYENKLLSEGKTADVAVIVTPNQKAVYKRKNQAFETSLVDRPQPIIAETAGSTEHNKKDSDFLFEQEKLLNVFEKIEYTYGIEIVPENTTINDCVFTGDVSTDDLYTKLKIICLTVNASYQINGTKILIKGNGCN